MCSIDWDLVALNGTEKTYVRFNDVKPLQINNCCVLIISLYIHIRSDR